MNKLVDILNESDFGDVFKPAEKDELVGKRGWALFNEERSEVTPLQSFEDVLRFSKLMVKNYTSLYRQGNNFYGVRDKESGNKFLVVVSLTKKLTVYDTAGHTIKYFME